jgi:hypothetical protein
MLDLPTSGDRRFDAIYACATCRYRGKPSKNVPFTLIPSLISCGMPGTHSNVAGTLMNTWGRSSAAWSRRASSIVPCVSSAR